ncbi:MAG: hypothetical protein NXH78_10220 [Hyphomonadaceae bacterium]|nr:hypothetical protein [Hyphomonadaceae bacterium]
MIASLASIAPETWVSLAAVFLAIGAFVRTIRWSHEQLRREALTRIADREFEWISDFRNRVASVSVKANILKQRSHKPNEGKSEELQEELLHDIGYLDLMFAEDVDENVARFINALFEFRDSVLPGKNQSEMGPKNLALRKAANSIIGARTRTARAALSGKGCL